MEYTDWYKCYGKSWTSLCVPAAFVHPAKFSRELIFRIYDYAVERRWIKEGSIVLDPFAGVCLGALPAMKHGLHWVGVELEEKFVELGQQNINLWNRRYAEQLPGWGTAIVIQGDSRQLIGVLKRETSSGVVSSPPYAGIRQDGGGEFAKSGKGGVRPYTDEPIDYWHTQRDQCNLGNLREGGVEAAISSPPFLAQSGGTNVTSKTGPLADESLLKRHSAGNVAAKGYGDAEGQLAAMPEGNVDAVVASPPFQSTQGKGGETKGFHSYDEDEAYNRCKRDYVIPDAEGQLGNMPEGNVEGIVSSPPYVASLASDDPDKRGGLFRDPKRRGDKTLTAEYGDSDGQLGMMRGGFEGSVSSPPFGKEEHSRMSQMRREVFAGRSYQEGNEYGGSEGQLGQEQAETFWSAAHLIVQQTYQVLSPGAYAIFVCKRFVRNKKIVEFSQQWCSLCEACGFELVKWIRAWLIEDRGAQYTLTGELEERTVARYSFFRRLHVKKYPKLAIEWEDVIVLRKPI